MMKNILFASIAILTFGFVSAQQKDGFRVGIDLGYAIPTVGGGGVIFTVEPKYNIANNINVGIKFGVAAMIKDIKYSNGQSTSAKVGAVSFYTGTFNYYFNKSGKDFVPFVGGGISYNSLANIEVNANNNNNVIINLDTNSKIGGLLMGGFEYQHFRMALEYNIIPSSKLQDINGGNLGTISNSYFGINLGFYIGGGKWGS